MINRDIDHYRIIEKIGEGGRGVVYKAEDTNLKRVVALKFLPAQHGADGESRARFEREARTAAMVNHANIVTIYGIGEFSGQLYIAMEYVDGRTLQEVAKELEREAPELAARKRIAIMMQVCDGLGHAHRHGIIHRDIKPQNIMIDRDGRVKILDFGMARLFGVRHLTADHVIQGTLLYVSPELLNGGEPDLRSDIWALGVMFYEMLGGRHPFHGPTPEAVIHAIIHREPEPLPPPCAPGGAHLERLLKKAMAKAPGQRYQSIEPLAADLKLLLEESPVPAAPGADAGREPIRIAVLPFADLSVRQDQEYFCDGIAEELVHMLAKIDGLRVCSRTSSFQFKGKQVDLRSISRKLNVQYVLEGSVRRAGNRLRVATRLVQAGDGSTAWSEEFNGLMRDVFRVQEEIALAVIGSLKLRLLAADRARLAKRHTVDLEAYNLFLRGRYFWNRRYEGGLMKSLDFYQQCIAKDENYALPHAAIAESLGIIGLYGFLPPQTAFERARAAALSALKIDPGLGEAHCSLAWVSNFFDWDWQAAETEFRRAVQLDSCSATCHEWYALFLAMHGRFPEARAAIHRALDLDPLSLIINSVKGLIDVFAHRFGEAVEQLRRTLELDANFLLARLWLGEAHLFQGQPEAALEQFRQVIADPGRGMITWALSAAGSAHARLERKREALDLYGQLEAIARQRYVPKTQMAQIFFSMDPDRAHALLQEALAERDAFLPWALSSPHFDPLRGQPRFQELFDRLARPPSAPAARPASKRDGRV